MVEGCKLFLLEPFVGLISSLWDAQDSNLQWTVWWPVDLTLDMSLCLCAVSFPAYPPSVDVRLCMLVPTASRHPALTDDGTSTHPPHYQ
jgi:hypothetical protein